MQQFTEYDDNIRKLYSSANNTHVASAFDNKITLANDDSSETFLLHL